MGKVNMKDTDYYKSGKQAENLRIMSEKAKLANRKKAQERISRYNDNPKLCQNCDGAIEYSKRMNKSCSTECGNKLKNAKKVGKPTSTETKKKISVSVKRYNESNPREPRVVSEEEFIKRKIRRQQKRKEKILQESWENLGWEIKRQRVIWEQNESCNNCELSKWQGQDITLEIDHIDGDRKNNERENLEGLCPNCHSLTETWRGRNKVKSKENSALISNEERVKAYLMCGNIRRALIHLNLSPKGGNYKTMKKALTEWDIDYK